MSLVAARLAAPSRRFSLTFAAWLVACAGAQTTGTMQPIGSTPPAPTPPTAPKITTPATTNTTTTPADPGAIFATVLETNGDAAYRIEEAGEWKPLKVGDKLPALTQIRTGIGGSAKLQIGEEEPYSAVVIDPVSALILSELSKTTEVKKVRVGVGYGRIRAGVAEGGLRSDFTVDSPVATLSKKGTWNFGLFYERSTDRFEIFLLDRGLVEALNKITGDLRTVKPGEAVTNAMRIWCDEAQLRRNVALADLLGQDDYEIAFNRLRNDGIGIVDVGSGNTTFLNLRDPNASNEFRNIVRDRLNTFPIIPPPIDFGRQLRPEGFFGTGGGDQLIQVIIDRDSFLSRGGFARPGNFTFRRAALEGWLNSSK